MGTPLNGFHQGDGGWIQLAPGMRGFKRAVASPATDPRRKSKRAGGRGRKKKTATERGGTNPIGDSTSAGEGRLSSGWEWRSRGRGKKYVFLSLRPVIHSWGQFRRSALPGLRRAAEPFSRWGRTRPAYVCAPLMRLLRPPLLSGGWLLPPTQPRIETGCSGTGRTSSLPISRGRSTSRWERTPLHVRALIRFGQTGPAEHHDQRTGCGRRRSSRTRARFGLCIDAAAAIRGSSSARKDR